MDNSKNTSKGYGNSKPLDELDKLLELDWNEDSNITVNINHPLVPVTPSERVRMMKITKADVGKAGVGGALVGLIMAIIEVGKVFGWW